MVPVAVQELPVDRGVEGHSTDVHTWEGGWFMNKHNVRGQCEAVFPIAVIDKLLQRSDLWEETVLCCYKKRLYGNECERAE